MSFESPEEWKEPEAIPPAAYSLPREPDRLIPTPLGFEESQLFVSYKGAWKHVMPRKSVEETIDDVSILG